MKYKIQVTISGVFCDSERVTKILSSRPNFQCALDRKLNLLHISLISESPTGGADLDYLRQLIGSDKVFFRSERMYTQLDLEQSLLFWVFSQSARLSVEQQYEYFDYESGCRTCGAGALRNDRRLLVNGKPRGSVMMDDSGLIVFRKDLLILMTSSGNIRSPIATREIDGPWGEDWCELEIAPVMPSLDVVSGGIAHDSKSACSQCGVGALYHSASVPFEPKYARASGSSLPAFHISRSSEFFGRSSRDSIRRRIISGARRDLLLSQRVRETMPKDHLKYLRWIPVEYSN